MTAEKIADEIAERIAEKIAEDYFAGKIKPRFINYTEAEQYEGDGVMWLEPMTAKELEDDSIFDSPDYYVEEKFDGTRALMHFFDGYTRIFSRRVSAKTGWFCENSDLLPQLRDIDIPELEGTVIDGEMFIPLKSFKEVAGIMNCNWDKAIERQIDNGFIVFHAFDILFYQYRDLRDMPLYKRKEYLQKVVDKVNSPYVKMVEYYDDKVPVRINKPVPSLYSALYNEWRNSIYPKYKGEMLVSKRAYYDYIVMNGREGVILKDKKGQYKSKRGREYQKVKKFLTRDVIVMEFTEPTKEYTGKFPDDRWSYWIDKHDNKQPFSFSEKSARELLRKGYIPVTKHYYEDWIGNIKFGVIISDDEIKKLPLKKPFNIERRIICGKEVNLIEVGECSGFDEETRQTFSLYFDDYEDTVIEVKANDLFKDTGKLRHPRFLRVRKDKSPLDCIWKDHINLEV